MPEEHTRPRPNGLCLLGTAAVALLAAQAWANVGEAQVPRTNLGTLTCTLGTEASSPATVTGDERAINCVFRPARGNAEQTYTGTMTQVRAARGAGESSVMIWAVWGPTGAETTPGTLGQSFVGPADRSEAAKTGLVGQVDGDFVLQPLKTADEADDDTVTRLELRLCSVPA